jgi:hypothetical protein
MNISSTLKHGGQSTAVLYTSVLFAGGATWSLPAFCHSDQGRA